MIMLRIFVGLWMIFAGISVLAMLSILRETSGFMQFSAMLKIVVGALILSTSL